MWRIIDREVAIIILLLLLSSDQENPTAIFIEIEVKGKDKTNLTKVGFKTSQELMGIRKQLGNFPL